MALRGTEEYKNLNDAQDNQPLTGTVGIFCNFVDGRMMKVLLLLYNTFIGLDSI